MQPFLLIGGCPWLWPLSVFLWWWPPTHPWPWRVPVAMLGSWRPISQHLSNEDGEGRNQRQGTSRLLCASRQEKNVNCVMRSLISERGWGSWGRGLEHVIPLPVGCWEGGNQRGRVNWAPPPPAVLSPSLSQVWMGTCPSHLKRQSNLALTGARELCLLLNACVLLPMVYRENIWRVINKGGCSRIGCTPPTLGICKDEFRLPLSSVTTTI